MVNEKQIIKTFFELIKIDSPSGREREVAKWIMKYCRSNGLNARRDSYGNVIVKLPGTGDPLALSAHMDTVQPGEGIKPRVKKGSIISDGRTILGADDKAGLAVILEAAKALKKSILKHRPLEIFLTREEEIGCKGALKLEFKKIKAKNGIVIDSTRPLGYIMLAEPFIYSIEICVIGRAAHAGACPEKGINALTMASKAISELTFGRINKSTTCNLGIIKGGTSANTVPEKVFLKGDVRSHFLDRVQAEVDKINKAFKKQVRIKKGKLRFKAVLEINGFSYQKSEAIVKSIAAMNRRMGIKTVYERSGGASDASIFAGKGIKMIGISYGGSGGHTTKETIKVKDLTTLTEWLINYARV